MGKRESREERERERERESQNIPNTVDVFYGCCGKETANLAMLATYWRSVTSGDWYN